MEWSKYGLVRLAVLIVALVISVSSSEASFTFNVGGKDGWVVKPSEDYTHWAQRYRFHVNDTLYFKYKRGTDSVLIVTKEDYDSCNTTKPLHRFKGGGSTIKLHKSGPFFFISGNVQNCKQGQKLTVLVMANSHNPHGHHSPSPSPSIPPTSTTTPPPSMAPANSPSVAPVTPNAPAPAPSKNSGSKNSFGVALGISFVMMVVFFSSFA